MLHEINLLPVDRRRALSRQRLVAIVDRIIRNITVGLVVVTVCGVVIAVVLQGLAFTFSKITDVDVEQQIARYESARADVMDKNAVIRSMSSVSSNRLVWSDMIGELLSVVPPGMNISKMGGEYGDSSSLSFEGNATSRNTLVVFEGRLRDLEWAAGVESPHSNLIQRVDPSFKFNIVLGGSDDISPDALQDVPEMYTDGI